MNLKPASCPCVVDERDFRPPVFKSMSYAYDETITG